MRRNPRPAMWAATASRRLTGGSGERFELLDAEVAGDGRDDHALGTGRSQLPGQLGKYCGLCGPVVAQEIGRLRRHVGVRYRQMQGRVSSSEAGDQPAVIELCGAQPDAADETYMHGSTSLGWRQTGALATSSRPLSTIVERQVQPYLACVTPEAAWPNRGTWEWPCCCSAQTRGPEKTQVAWRLMCDDCAWNEG
jgi:hypothetical protein